MAANQSHQFALYVHNLSSIACDQKDCVLSDPDLVHRIARVLRLREGDVCVLFDVAAHWLVQIKQIGKKTIICHVRSRENNVQYHPALVAWLPLLKRDALEAAIYSLVEVGVQSIQLVLTEKVQRKWYGQKEYGRLRNIMIAAAEQAKVFLLPTLHEPQPLPQLLRDQSQEVSLFFDVDGLPLLQAAQQLVDMHKSYTLFVGPEGDLTDDEKGQLKQNGWLFVRLTPTVLRAQQAMVLAVGAIRSLL